MKALFPSLLLLVAHSLAGQSDYFQQSVDYRIVATLDDQTHTLHAQLELDYRNNSPDALTEIYFHLWPRAFRSDNTAFARQKLRDGSTRFHFSEAAQRGDLDSLAFQQGDQALSWEYETDNPDIALVKLAQPLQAGERTTISTPFRVKIPASFSRLGHVGESYQMTQWFPKPAVYDRDGWHPMPYLDRGEFYSEFGNFDVTITLPENYLVGATGTLQNAEEREWLLAQAAKNQQTLRQREDLSGDFVREAFPASSSQQKTLRYTAERVHDFAWFADKRFKVLHGTTKIKGKKEIDVWSFFTETEAELWQNSVDYLVRSVNYYSDQVGAYPYPQVTGVQSALSAGGGMEYPMVTVIGQSGNASSLDEVLAHEVGHNWFYGVLATNERTHPWMDEGFNSYYEARYMDENYGKDRDGFQMFGRKIDIDQLGYLYQSRQGNGQSPDMDSDSMSANNYWMNAYSKPAMALRHLATIYGQTEVDAAMQTYFQEWQFRHPGPADVQAVFEEVLEADLSWFFQGLMQSPKTYDVRLKKDKKTVKLTRLGEVELPVSLESETPNTPTIVISPPAQIAGDFSHVDAGPLDLYPGNNFAKRPLNLQPAINAEIPGQRQVFWAPLAGYNVHDGFQLGGMLHNRTMEPRRFEWLIAPQFGFKSAQVNGFAGIRYRFPVELIPALGKNFRQWLFSFGYETYGHRTFEEDVFRYQRFGLSLRGEFRHPAITGRTSSLALRITNLQADQPGFNNIGELDDTRSIYSHFFRAVYQRDRKHAINPSRSSLALEFGLPGGFLEDDFTKLSAEMAGGYQYDRKQWIKWRLFGGYFITNELRERNNTPGYAFGLVDNAATDYRYEGIYAGRNENNAFSNQHIGGDQGGFRAPISNTFGFGRSNDYMLAVNLDANIPFLPPGFPLALFLDVAAYGRTPIRSEGEAALQWTTGASLTFFNDQIGIFLPLAGSSDVIDLLKQNDNYLERISVRIELSKLLPWRWLDGISL